MGPASTRVSDVQVRLNAVVFTLISCELGHLQRWDAAGQGSMLRASNQSGSQRSWVNESTRCTAQLASQLRRTCGSVAVLLWLAGELLPSTLAAPLSAAPVPAAGVLSGSDVLLPVASAPPRNHPNRFVRDPDVAPAARGLGILGQADVLDNKS